MWGELQTGEAVEEPEPRIVRAAAAGDLEAFEGLVRRYQGPVWRLCMQLLHNEGMADDVTQEAFTRAWRFLSRYRADAKFSTWLFTIARNCALDELRRNERHRRTSDLLHRARPVVPSDADYSIEVRDAVASLDMAVREPLVLIDMFGMSYQETAAVLAIPVGTVKSRVHRGRALLAVALAATTRGTLNEG